MPKKSVKAIKHTGDKRRNIPTVESENIVRAKESAPKSVEYSRTPDDLSPGDKILSPELVWAGKNADANPLKVEALPIYVQEKIQPKAIIDNLIQQTAQERVASGEDAADLFENFNGLHDPIERTEFYQHMQNWTNRMILGDSLQVMASLAEKESMRGKVQCIYMDPPYGIKFSSNWQPDTQSRTVKDSDESYEPEMIRAFRDTWHSGVNSYLSYLRDRLTVARDLLTDSGSIFVQISDENVHLVRCLLDEVFGANNFSALITFTKTNPLGSKYLARTCDYLIWYVKDINLFKYRPVFLPKSVGKGSGYTNIQLSDGTRRKMTSAERTGTSKIPNGAEEFSLEKLFSTGYTSTCFYDFYFNGRTIKKGTKSWRTTQQGMSRLIQSGRIHSNGKNPGYVLKFSDFPMRAIDHLWNDSGGASDMVYVVQTSTKIIQRCMLMTTDPGDLVIDPTCGSGTTAFVAEQWGRRWITIDNSRVSLALARTRLMGGKFDYYLMQDSKEGADKESEISGQSHHKTKFTDNVQHGFVYERVPHITLRSIANNPEIGKIHERHQASLESLRKQLNAEIGTQYEEWQIPSAAAEEWNDKTKKLHAEYIAAKQKRQKEMDDSIAQNADMEMLVDRPYVEKNVVRVTGPFTVESLSPHRVLPINARDEDIDARAKSEIKNESRFLEIILDNLKKSGVQNIQKKDKLEFESLEPWSSGQHIQFIGRYNGGKKAAICVGPEYGTVTRSLLVNAVRESCDYFDVLVVLGFAFEAYANNKMLNIGDFPVVCARMNHDLHMADRLKSGGGNLFVSFGEPDIEIHDMNDNMATVEIKGIDIFDPATGEQRASNTEDIACWFVDTNYNGESFFVRHAYFCGGGKDPYNKLKTALNAEINAEAWESLRATISRPFVKPIGGNIAVKAINRYGDEVMKVFHVK